MGRLCHPLRRPGWIEHHLHTDLAHGWKAGAFPLNVWLKHLAHSAPWHRHGHGDLDLADAVALCILAGIYDSLLHSLYSVGVALCCAAG